MKKKLLAVVAAVMMLSMSMTALAVDSPSTATTEFIKVDKVAVAKDALTAVTEAEGAKATAVTVEVAEKTAKEVAKVVAEGKTANVLAVVDLTAAGEPDADGNYNITLTVPEIKAGTSVYVLHIKDDGTTEKLDATVVDGKISFKVKSFSTFAIVEEVAAPATGAGKAPKTGETGTMIPVLALICFAGMAVCAYTKKVKAC